MNEHITPTDMQQLQSEEDEKELFRDCEWFGERYDGSDEDGGEYVYAPCRPDADLDAELLERMQAQCRGRSGGSDGKSVVAVDLSEHSDGYYRATDGFHEQFMVGHVCRGRLPRCAGCNLVVPADLEYYCSSSSGAKEEEEVLCRVCYPTHPARASFSVSARRDTGLENVSDWIMVCTVHTTYLKGPQDWGERHYFYPIYCNLNKTSKMHGQIAYQYYVSGGCGDVLKVQPPTKSLEDLLLQLGVAAAAAAAQDEK